MDSGCGTHYSEVDQEDIEEGMTSQKTELEPTITALRSIEEGRKKKLNFPESLASWILQRLS